MNLKESDIFLLLWLLGFLLSSGYWGLRFKSISGFLLAVIPCFLFGGIASFVILIIVHAIFICIFLFKMLHGFAC